jgi:hypothetical protein
MAQSFFHHGLVPTIFAEQSRRRPSLVVNSERLHIEGQPFKRLVERAF